MEPGSSHADLDLAASDPLLATCALLPRACGGDRLAQGELFTRYREPLERFLHARLPGGARGLAETQDVVQEVFTRCVSALAEFEPRGIGSFWGFLRRIATNHMIDLARRRSARTIEPLASASSFGPAALEQSPLSRLVGDEEMRSFETALATLPARQREALLMRIELDLDYRTIAKDCGYPSPEAARMSITRALQDLCREMTRGAGSE